MNKKTKDILKVLLFLIVGLVILYVVYLRSEEAYQAECVLKGIASEDCDFIGKISSDIASANYWWILVALFVYMLSNVARALRWNMLLEPLGYKPRFLNSFGILMVGYLTNLGIPRSGEFVKAGLMSKYEGYDAEKVMGTIVVDRILDVLSLLVVICLTLLLSYQNFVGYFRDNAVASDGGGGFLNMTTLSIGGVLGIVFLAIIWMKREQIFSTAIGQKIKKILTGFWEGILTIKDVSNPILFIVYSIVIWVCYFLMTYLMFFSFVPTENLGLVAGLVVFVFGTLGIIIPTPGGIGTYQFLISEALQKLYGLEMSDSFSFANILFFTVQLFCNILIGIIMLIFLPLYNNGKKENT